MATLAMNKSVLKRERERLARFQRFLPSLELKRKQLVAELNRARKILTERDQEMDRYLESKTSLFSLLGPSGLDLSGLVRVKSVSINDENILGVRVPSLDGVEFQVAEYSMLARPFWVDSLTEAVKDMSEMRIRRQVEQERVECLQHAVRRITQRVNLFEKVLIPSARQNIRRISVYLADADRAAVVRAKIAKARH